MFTALSRVSESVSSVWAYLVAHHTALEYFMELPYIVSSIQLKQVTRGFVALPSHELEWQFAHVQCENSLHLQYLRLPLFGRLSTLEQRFDTEVTHEKGQKTDPFGNRKFAPNTCARAYKRR